MHLAHPWFLTLLLLLPLVAWGRRVRRRWEGGLTFPAVRLLEGLPVPWPARLQPLRTGLRLVALALLIVALARPQAGFRKEKVTRSGIDIILALDVSPSMSAQDFQPSRVAVARRVIAEFIRGLHNDRLGLIVFAGRSFTQSPLTLDYGIILDLLHEVDVGMVAINGTAIGEAIANAIYRFESEDRRRQSAAPPSGERVPRRSRVLILLTDGENNTGRVSPLMAAEMAQIKGIRIHTIGLGTLEGVPVPFVGPDGKRGFYRDQEGRLVITRLDEDTLRDIADTTGGRYFRATDAHALAEIYRQIGQMEKHEIEVEHFTQYEERLLWFLLPALGLLLLEGGLAATVLRVVR
jgi:Ca-activated chloride channel family protein